MLEMAGMFEELGRVEQRAQTTEDEIESAGNNGEQQRSTDAG